MALIPDDAEVIGVQEYDLGRYTGFGIRHPRFVDQGEKETPRIAVLLDRNTGIATIAWPWEE
jgi:hypothetical protein